LEPRDGVSLARSAESTSEGRTGAGDVAAPAGPTAS